MRCRRASCRWFPRVASASLSRCPFAPPSTPRETRKCVVTPMSDCTTSSGHGADVFPRWRSRTLRACVSRVFVATSFQSHCSIARLRRCEPPPSADVFRGRMYLRTACATVLTACPAVPADPKSARSIRSFGRPRGPGRLRCYAPRSSNDGTRGDGGGSHRLTGPVASSCAPADVHQSHACLLHAATGSTRARAGRPAVRPLLSSNAGLCFHRAGRLQKLFRPMQRVHPDRYRTGIRVSAVQLCFYPRDILQMSTHHTEPRRAAGSLS